MMKIFKKLNLFIVSFIFLFYGMISVNAASASITVSSSTSSIVVGNTFTVTIKVSSSVALGSWEFTPSYDTKRLKLVSGTTPVVGYSENSSTKTKSYSYTFKALATGNANIGVKSTGAYAWDESKLSISTSSKTVKIITQAELEASYSKDNYLKSLSIDGLTLSPAFSKTTTSYTAEADSNTNKITIKATVNDSKSRISGVGNFEVSEGENKFNIVVTAQNGSTRTYSVIVNVIDPNPVKINIDDQEYTVIKRESLLENVPNNFEKTKVKINEQEVPGFYNEINDFTIVGVKNTEGEVIYILCNNDNYSVYNEIKLNQLEIYPLNIDKTFDGDYNKSITKINDIEFESLKMNNSEFSIIHAKDLNTGKNNYYLYDSILNTITRYTDENTIMFKNKIKNFEYIIYGLIGESILLVLIIVCMLISKIVKNKKRRKLIKEEMMKQEITLEEKDDSNEVVEEVKEEKKNTKKKSTKKNTKKKSTKKEGITDEKEESI